MSIPKSGCLLRDRFSLEVALLPQEGIVWEIEPLPKNYEREILSF
ncbi:MAG: hypothetical protein RMZ41_000505 [Nostoc sp. DedVER02]|nr:MULTISPECIES: hypothetical protein [unclassified Nostoc]MDZ7987977.1 hypothetical protein [Nostoc sp. DedVER02]MDZ8114901.1 hypothetical protein [Nostoc sp. DedVER01b]